MIYSPSEGERERYAVPASLDAAGEIGPGFRPSEGTPPYGSSPFTKENGRNPAGRALICAANHVIAKLRRKTKGEHRENSVLSRFLAANAPLSGSKESWGVARGDRKPWCPVPFCPSPREGRVPARRSVHSPSAGQRFNPYRMPQIPYTPYKGQASRCTRRVRAWKGPERRRPRCQYCGLRGTSRPYRRRPDRRGRADRSAR